MQLTINLLVIDHRDGSLIGLADSPAAAVKLAMEHAFEHSLDKGRGFEACREHLEMCGGQNGHLQSTFLPFTDQSESPEHQSAAVKITTMVVKS